MPTLLANVRFRTTQTWHLHLVCTRLATIILAWMILVTIAACFWTPSPVAHMPADPTTLGGIMYYLVDKELIDSINEGKLLKFGTGREERVGIWVDRDYDKMEDYKALGLG